MSRWRTSVSVTALALTAILSAACGSSGGSGAESGDPNSPETTSLNVPTAAASAAEGPQVYAAAAGYYKKYGLSVSTPVSDSGTVLSEFTAGSVPLDSVGQQQVAALYAKGFPVEVIACTNTNLPFHMFAQSSITSVKDLVGKTIGTTALNSGHELAEQHWLLANGVNPSQVHFVALGSVPDILAGLKSGSIAAGGLSYPVWEGAVTDSKLHLIGDAHVPPSSWVVSAKWAKSNQNTILAYLKGSIEGFYAYYAYKSGALPVLAKFLNLNLSDATDKAMVEQAYQTYLPPALQPITECASNWLSDWVFPYIPASQRTAITSKQYGAFIDDSYIQKLISSGFYQQMQQKYGAVKGFTLPS